jgi:hypothetical protein
MEIVYAEKASLELIAQLKNALKIAKEKDTVKKVFLVKNVKQELALMVVREKDNAILLISHANATKDFLEMIVHYYNAKMTVTIKVYVRKVNVYAYQDLEERPVVLRLVRIIVLEMGYV